MALLYELEIQSFPNGDKCERYGIGVFRTRQDAEAVAYRYLNEVKGFKDYYCEYSIRETELIGDDNGGPVHTWEAWDLDEEGDEIDLLSGLFYADPTAAEAAMAAAKKVHDRQEWVLNWYEIGKCEWAEGFVREFRDPV